MLVLHWLDCAAIRVEDWGWSLLRKTLVAMVIPQIRKAREQKHVYVFSHGSLSTFNAPFQSWTGAQISEQRSRDACCFRTFPSFNCSQSWYGSFKSPWPCSRHLPRPRACSITRWQLFTFHQNSCAASLHAYCKSIHALQAQAVSSLLECLLFEMFTLIWWTVTSPWTLAGTFGAKNQNWTTEGFQV